MGERYLIDSNAIIDYLSGKFPDLGMSFMSDVVNAIPNVSVISKIEVLGFNTPSESYQLLSDFFEDAIVFDLTTEIVAQAIELRKAHKIKLGDSIIAATALVYDFELITRNTSDFKQIVKLQLMNPHDF